jgi:hypothetical protein
VIQTPNSSTRKKQNMTSTKDTFFEDKGKFVSWCEAQFKCKPSTRFQWTPLSVIIVDDCTSFFDVVDIDKWRVPNQSAIEKTCFMIWNEITFQSHYLGYIKAQKRLDVMTLFDSHQHVVELEMKDFEVRPLPTDQFVILSTKLFFRGHHVDCHALLSNMDEYEIINRVSIRLSKLVNLYHMVNRWKSDNTRTLNSCQLKDEAEWDDDILSLVTCACLVAYLYNTKPQQYQYLLTWWLTMEHRLFDIRMRTGNLKRVAELQGWHVLPGDNDSYVYDHKCPENKEGVHTILKQIVPSLNTRVPMTISRSGLMDGLGIMFNRVVVHVLTGNSYASCKQKLQVAGVDGLIRSKLLLVNTITTQTII